MAALRLCTHMLCFGAMRVVHTLHITNGRSQEGIECAHATSLYASHACPAWGWMADGMAYAHVYDVACALSWANMTRV